MKTLHSLAVGVRPAFSILARRITCPLLLFIAGLALAQPSAGQSGTWTETGRLATARWVPTATLLPDGKVLVACGTDSDFFALGSAELYDPASGTWSTTGSLPSRAFHTATLLPDGTVLVAGGYNREGGFALAIAQLYDPASGTWTATGSLVTARQLHTATLLPNGKVLVAGGYDEDFSTLMSAELYDPATGTWTATGSLATAPNRHTATLLPDGKVLVAGGFPSLASAELYDPASGTWTATGSLATARYEHTATLLPNGKVLVAGGAVLVADGAVIVAGGPGTSAELYDPASGTWTATGNLATGRSSHTATLLANGKVLVAGGAGASAELYDPANGTWTATGSLGTARDGHTATLLPDGKVLAAGGYNFDIGALSSAELYVSDGGGGLTLVSAASIQRGFAIDLPISGPSGVEDRSGGPNKKYTVAMTFDQNIVSVGSASSTCGGVQSIVIDSADPHKVKLNLVNVAHGCNGSTITVTADSITDDQGNVLDSASVGLGLLLGDVNADRVVNQSDYNEARMHKGQKADEENFRNDVNANGHIEHSDITLIGQQQGTSLP